MTPEQEQAVARLRQALTGRRREVEHIGPEHRPHSIVRRSMAHAAPADLIALCEAIGDAPKANEMKQGAQQALELGAPEGSAVQASCLHELLDLLDAKHGGTPTPAA